MLLGAPVLVAQHRRALPPLADRVLLADVARKHLGYFAPVAETPGFGEALFRLVRELRGAGYDLADLGPLLDGATDAPEKAGSLAEILVSFERRRAGFYGPDDALVAADPARLDGLGLLVWGLLDMPPALERLIVGVAERMPVVVYLPDVPAAAEAPVAALGRRLLGRGGSEIVVPPIPRLGTALGQVRRGFVHPAVGARDRGGRHGACWCRRRIRRGRCGRLRVLVWSGRRTGVEFWEMAVAYRHGEAYRPLVEAVFIEAGIPLYLHEGSPLAERPLGRQTLALLDLYESDLSRRSVMDFLTDAWFPGELREQYGGSCRPRAGTRSRVRLGSSAAPSSGRSGSLRYSLELAGDERRRISRTGCATGSPTSESSRGSSPSSIGVLAPIRGGRPGPTHLDYLRDLLARYVSRSEEIVLALRGLERFTALEAEVEFDRFLEVVRRALGTLRSEDVLEGRPGRSRGAA